MSWSRFFQLWSNKTNLRELNKRVGVEDRVVSPIAAGQGDQPGLSRALTCELETLRNKGS